MRYLVLSDVHANLEALEAVLEAERSWTQVLVLGDLVGYGADPNAVVDRIRALPIAAMVRGNHDKVATGLAPVDSFNPVARHAIGWTTRVLTPENHAWLAALPEGPTPLDEHVEICHGAPHDEDFYVFDELDAQRASAGLTRPVCLFGHTHVACVFRIGAGRAAGPDPGGRCPTCSSTPPRARRSSTAAPSASRGTAIHAPPTASWTPPPAR